MTYILLIMAFLEMKKGKIIYFKSSRVLSISTIIDVYLDNEDFKSYKFCFRKTEDGYLKIKLVK